MSRALQPHEEPRIHQHPIRVYWEDTDAGGIVYHANYLKFFERARTEWLRNLGFNQQAMRADTDSMFVVQSLSLHYFAGSQLDDELGIQTALTQLGQVSCTLTQIAYRDSTKIAAAQIKLGFINDQTFRPVRFGDGLKTKLQSVLLPDFATHFSLQGH